MPPQRVTFRLSQLRCIKESDTKGGSEPYLWVTYFAVDGRNLAPTPVTTDTFPATFIRTEFPNNVADGQVINLSSSLSPRSFDIDRGSNDFMMAGCIAVLLEEDETPEDAILAGHLAYKKEIAKQLNALVNKRISTVDRSNIKPEEVKVIREAIESKVSSAIEDNLSLREKLFDNQDDLLGFTFVNFINDDIRTRTLRFPEIFEGDDRLSSSNRYVLSGSVSSGPVPPDPIELCPKQRAALNAKRQQIKGLESSRLSLQLQLATATPQQKPGINDAIDDIDAELNVAEEELPALEAALKKCLADPHVGTHIDVSNPVVVTN